MVRIITSNLEEEFRKARDEANTYYVVERPGYYRPVRGNPRIGTRLLESEELTPAERRALKRTAQGITTSPSGGDVLYAEPDIIGPLFDPINWYLPYTYKVLNRWIRYYVRFHPVVGNCIDMHAEIPLSRFALTGIDDETILREYEEIFEELQLYQNLLDMAREYWSIGEVFPFLHWNEDEQCFDHITILNPDYVNVVYTPLAYGSDVQFELEPDDNLIRIVKGSDPMSMSLRENLDPIVIEAIEAGTNIPLDPFNVSQIARKQSPYDLRGTSIILRCLKDLLYEDYLRRAQFAVAQRLITPLRIFQLGDPQGDWIPSPEDVDAFAELLAQGSNDPNFAIIGNYALKVEYVGATGKVLPIVPEFEFVTDRILTALFTNKAMTTGQGPCVSIDTETLTENGWKRYDEIDDRERIATFNPETGEIEFKLPDGRVCFEYDGYLVEIESDYMTQFTTPNHRTYVKRGDEYIVTKASDVLPDDRITCKVKWEGVPLPDPISTPKLRYVHGKKLLKTYSLGLDLFLELLGYFAATGLTTRHRPQFRDTAIRYVFAEPFEPLEKLLDKVPFILSRYNYKLQQYWYVAVYEPVAALFAYHVGRTPTTRRLSKELRNAPPEQLRIFVDAFLRANEIDPSLPKGRVVVKSEAFAGHLQEIFLKLGYAAKVTEHPDRSGWYFVEYSSLEEDLESTFTVRKRRYRGLVYSFEVPNHLYIVRRNGKVIITGNTYANASVAFEVLQMRYLALRGLFELWIREKIAKPIAIARGYIKRTKAELDHKVRVKKRKPTYYLPEINWLSKMNLLDDTQQKTFLLRLRERGDIPLKKICEVFDYDYDELIRDLKAEMGTVADPQYRMRLQQILAQEQMQTQKPQQPSTPPTPLVPPRLGPMPTAKKKDTKELKRKEVRKIFGPRPYAKKGEVYYTNEEAIENALQEDSSNVDQDVEGKQGPDEKTA